MTSSTTEWRDADKRSIEAWLEPASARRGGCRRARTRGCWPRRRSRASSRWSPSSRRTLPFVGVHAPTKPSAAVIEPWIERVEAAERHARERHAARGGRRARAARRRRRIDERAATVIVEGFELDTVQAAVTEIARQALLDPLIASIAEQLADTVATDLSRRPLLRELCKNDQALRRAQAQGDGPPEPRGDVRVPVGGGGSLPGPARGSPRRRC